MAAWLADRDSLLEQANLNHLRDCGAVLAYLREGLVANFARTFSRIDDGTNTQV